MKRKEANKAQVTLFLIVGIAIVAALLFFFIIGKEKFGIFESPNKIIKNYASDCALKAYEKSILLLSEGSLGQNHEYLDLENRSITYFYYNGENKMPSLSELREEIRNYISESILFCLDGINITNVKIEKPEEIKVNVFLGENITVYSEIPLVLKKVNKIIKLNVKNKKTYDINFLLIYNETKKIVDTALLDPEWTDLSELLNSELEITISPISSEKTLVYTLKDKNSFFQGKNFDYNFALKFK